MIQLNFILIFNSNIFILNIIEINIFIINILKLLFL